MLKSLHVLPVLALAACVAPGTDKPLFPPLVSSDRDAYAACVGAVAFAYEQGGGVPTPDDGAGPALTIPPWVLIARIEANYDLVLATVGPDARARMEDIRAFTRVDGVPPSAVANFPAGYARCQQPGTPTFGAEGGLA